MPLSYDALVDKLEGLLGEIVNTGGQRERTRAYFGVPVLANSGGPAPIPPANFVRIRLEGVAQLAYYFGAEPTVADIVDCLMIDDNTPIIFLNRAFGSMGPHDLLDNHLHPDTVAAAPLEGALVVGDATPEWDRLVHPAAAGYALVSDANTVVWDQTPDWTGRHKFSAGGLVGTGQDWDPEDAEGQVLGDATHRWDLFTQELGFGGGSTDNQIWIPDNLANALYVVDDGDGDVYLQIVTTTGLEEVIFNAGADDVDFTVQAVGHVDALQVQGSDGQITLGVLTAGYVKSSAGGVLSVALEVPLIDLGSYTQGDLIYGGGADWQDLAHPGAANRVLQSTAAEVGWSAQAVTFPTAGAVPVGTGGANQVAYWTGANALAGNAGLLVDAANDMFIVADAGGIGNAVATARLMFDSSGAADFVNFEGCLIGSGITPIWQLHIDKPGITDRVRIRVGNSDPANIVNKAGFDFAAMTTVQSRSFFYMEGNFSDITDATRTSYVGLYHLYQADARPAMRMYGDSVVFNEDADDVDFRVEAVGQPDVINVRGADGHIGLFVVPHNERLVYLARTTTDPATTIYGMQIRHTVSATGNNAQSLYAMAFNMVTDNVAHNFGTLYGVQGAVSHYGSGIIATAYGSWAGARVYGAGDITLAYGLYITSGLGGGTGDIVTNYGIMVKNPLGTGAGVITTNYALYLENQTRGATNYAIYSAGGKSYHAGYFGLNRTVPQGLLHGYDTISGFLHWEYDGVAGVALSVLPHGAGDVVYYLSVRAVTRASDGGIQSKSGSIAPGNTIDIYDDAGGNVCTLAVAADGSVTVQRTAGALTYKVGLWLLWL